MQSIFPNGAPLPLLLGVAAVFAYLCGCFNGAVIVSKYILRNDVRNHGSGNAGLTNFFRTFGGPLTFVVILCDVLKAVVALLVSQWLMFSGYTIFISADFTVAYWDTFAKYWAGLFCLLGHMFPCMFQFKGGKGILCSGTLLLMLDWRIALAGWGLFLLFWLTTRYVSLGSVAAAVSFPISTFFCFRTPVLTVLSLLIAGLVLWAHRGNIVRLVQGKESKFRWHGKEDKT